MTIFALSTPPGRGAIAMIRLSGEKSSAALKSLSALELPDLRRASVRLLSDPRTGQLIDEAVVLRFEAPHSFTGEDMLELHVHGGLAVVDSLLDALASIDGLRPAEAGEFSKRAVLNGRLDLTRAEGIADLIDAESEAQKQQALRQMSGALGQLYEKWRDQIKTGLAHLEADLEFAEEDLPGGLGQSALDGLAALLPEMRAHLSEDRGERLREGVCVAIIGPPNAGKSSIINRLAGRDAAIVSARAGTTRDVVEVAMVLGGVPVTLSDTAGLREAQDEIEQEGVRRARLRAEEAELRLLVTAPDVEVSHFDGGAVQDIMKPGDFWLHNKSDLMEPSAKDASVKNEGSKFRHYTVSAQTDHGIDDLLNQLSCEISRRFGLSERPALTRVRHRKALEEAVSYLQSAMEARSQGLELAAEDLRMSSRALGRITGTVDVEALLDIVFADFCIGK